MSGTKHYIYGSLIQWMLVGNPIKIIIYNDQKQAFCVVPQSIIKMQPKSKWDFLELYINLELLVLETWEISRQGMNCVCCINWECLSHCQETFYSMSQVTQRNCQCEISASLKTWNSALVVKHLRREAMMELLSHSFLSPASNQGLFVLPLIATLKISLLN